MIELRKSVNLVPSLRVVDENGELLQTLTFVNANVANAMLQMQDEARAHRRDGLIKAAGLPTARVAETIAATPREMREQLTAQDESGASAGFGVGQRAGKPTAAKDVPMARYVDGYPIDTVGLDYLRRLAEAGELLHDVYEEEWKRRAKLIVAPDGGPELPTPVSDIASYLVRQIKWSRHTFGPAMRTGGIIEHIGKELVEVEKDPFDLLEWIDIIILALDGYWRHGGSAHRLMDVLCAKQQKNFARQWPNWRDVPDGTAIEHKRG